MQSTYKSKGFTLLEVIVASVIGAFIAVISVSFLRSAIASRNFVDENITVADEVRYAANLLRKDFANIYRDVNKSKIRFDGDLDEVGTGFATNLTMHVVSCSKARPDFAEGDIYEVQYMLMQEEGKSLLMRRLCPVIGNENPEQTQGGILTVIAENITAFSVMYFDGSEWTEDWLDKRGVPVLVEITLTAFSADMFDQDWEGDYDMFDEQEMETPAMSKNAITKSFMVCFTRDGREPAGVDPGSDNEDSQQGDYDTEGAM